MIAINTLAHRPINKVDNGNLLYLLDDEAPTLAIKVDHPAGQDGDPSHAAAVVLHGVASGRRMPLTRPDLRTQLCIDWGMRPTVLCQHPLKQMPKNAQRNPDVGFIVLSGNEPALTSHYSGGRGNMLYWNLLTGKATDIGQSGAFVILEWRLGFRSADGAFQQLAEYPRDYGSTPPKKV